jgi:hypothetical protein
MASADNKCCFIITHMCVYRLGFSFEFYVVRFMDGFYPYEKISWGQLPRFNCLNTVLEHTLCSILTLKVRFAVHNIPIMLSLLTQLFLYFAALNAYVSRRRRYCTCRRSRHAFVANCYIL